MNHRNILWATLGTLGLIITPHALAAYQIILTESGGNVVATASGSINTAGLTANGNSSLPIYINAGSSYIYVGSSGANTDEYITVSGPSSFGSGGASFGSSGSGSMVGLTGGSNLLVPHGYVSGSSISGSAVWNGATLNSLGVTKGTYTWVWGSGATADSLTLYAGTTPGANSVPSLNGLGQVGLALVLSLVGLWGIRGRLRREGRPQHRG
jgi:hypothetical protein